MKKILFISLVIALVFATACSGGSSSGIDTDANEGDVTTVADETNGEGEKVPEEEVPISLEDIKPEIIILEPDSAGAVYMEATFINNTEYPITGYDLTILLKDKNEKAYLSTYDTVMPGEVSPKFESFGPDTQDPNDYEMLKLEVQAKKDDGKILSIEYDFKLGEATWNEYEE